jgi:SAM-dependent methyltransferase
MTDWTNGYIADIGYTYGYYHALNPLRANLALLYARVALPGHGTACELGYGQGISANIHAAASATRWHGTDFNPAQAGFAQELAAHLAESPALHDQSFAEFCHRADLPDFDYIGLHGIWSWISDDNRAVIVDFVRRKLKVGGVLYISYNTQPGWAAMVPLRNLMAQHAATMAAPGAGTVAQVDGALAFADKLMAANPLYARANPGVAERLKTINSHDRKYLAHEYFNRDWVPMSFADMAGWLVEAKLDYACSASYADLVPELNLTTPQRAVLDEIPDPVFRESVYDFMVNQQFRRDYWIKGRRQLQPLEYSELLRAQRLVMCVAREDVTLTIAGVIGEGTLSADIYNPILDLMRDYQVRTVGEIEQTLSAQRIALAQLHQACVLLVEKNVLGAALDEAQVAARRPETDKLNRALIQRAHYSAEIPFLASPVLGGGYSVHRFQQLFIAAQARGKARPGEWAEYAWQVLKSQGQAIVKDGGTLEGDDANMAELSRQAAEFQEKLLPPLRALGVI